MSAISLANNRYPKVSFNGVTYQRVGRTRTYQPIGFTRNIVGLGSASVKRTPAPVTKRKVKIFNFISL